MPIPTIVFQTGTSKVQQIVEALNQAIDQGRLSPGAKLPSAREMTEAWGVSKFTLIEALDRLRGQDRITSSQGLGYFVATRGPVAQRAAALDLLPQDLTSVLRRSLTGASGAMRPGSGHLPESWLEPSAMRNHLRQLSRSPDLRLTGYGDPAGYLPLRLALQQKLLGQGQDVAVEQIITTANTVQALDMLLRLRVRPGDTVLLDMPCYFNFHANLALHGARVMTLERTPQGLDLSALQELFEQHRPSLYLTTGLLHNPTGHSYSAAQAYGLLELAKRYDCHIIEDDLYGDWHPDPPHGSQLWPESNK
jgi:Transcriptional regulators containing a DNA-binding HTH domain and an aminotransferase domain (MocR family) and their eukaryotic orthologs